MLLEIKNLSVHYFKNKVIKDISLNIEKGNIYSIIGANGSGKTTLLRSISGLKSISSGSIIFNGIDITHSPAHNIVKLGIAQVPEGWQVFGPMTVIENL